MRLIPVGRMPSILRQATRPLTAFIAVLTVLVCCLGVAHAHPIVSTDINRHVTLTVADDRIEIRYLYEMLEIAALNTARTWDVDGDGVTAPHERDEFLAAWSAEAVRDLHVALDGTPARLSLSSARWEQGEGAMGLKTWKLVATLAGTLPVGSELGALEYRDLLRPGEVGWKEVMLVARGGTTVARSSVPSQDRSYELTDFAAMADLPNPNETGASAVLRFPESVVPEAARTGRSAGTQVPTSVGQVAVPEQPSAAAGSAAADKLQQLAPVAEEPAPPASPSPQVTRRDAEPFPRTSLQSAWGHYAWPFFKLGMHHIATGLDHMLFLLGLLLFRQSLARLAVVITCFTLAHSVTLAAAAAGWITPPGMAIEVLIASSIAYVGAATLLRPGSGHGPWIALAFGLVHGFGFAGALNEALGGMSGDRAWLVALASFNLGIEALQLMAVAVAWPLIQHVDRLKASVTLRRALSAVVMGGGIAWVMARMTHL
jgi:hypothetical protein